MVSFGERLRDERTRLGMTQERLGELAGLLGRPSGFMSQARGLLVRTIWPLLQLLASMSYSF